MAEILKDIKRLLDVFGEDNSVRTTTITTRVKAKKISPKAKVSITVNNNIYNQN